ncbi:PQQ-binding-like beta-propeller repeat protein [Micromonospora chaiyaphumensis]|uniref:Outer membrane protein assembly factor BamB, contains PQQ-like beta-propeller repeat n=1 Tax=Micromonospora chaiyaphumensis TaxID=307119 RepID=A0A1C4XQI8_9ACTN|nr:PQQ-binding-like beta-propeller repeat protein [Micromonospora chaiyaphumensis]SCF10684.1 Outer membrane protein assembly factor BamB, contains PQQ-like beta-propeller repeat [Micromonospora chaiyaphumensis]
MTNPQSPWQPPHPPAAGPPQLPPQPGAQVPVGGAPQAAQPGWPQPAQVPPTQGAHPGWPSAPQAAHPQAGHPAYPVAGQPVSPQAGQPAYPQAGPPAYPPQGWPNAAPTPPAAPRRRGRLALLLAGGLVAVLAVGAGTAYGVSRLIGGSSAGDGDLKTAWVLDFPERQNMTGLTAFDQEDMFGAWLVGDNVVRAQADGVLAYRLSDGGQAWGAPAPDGTSVCVAAQAVTDGRGAVAVGSDKSCNTVAGVDLNSGKVTWQAKFPAPVVEGRDMLTAPDLSVAGQQVIVRSEDTLIGLSLATGKQLWRTTGEKQLPGRDCGFRDMRAADDLVVVTYGCSRGGEVDALDPATGKVRWRQRLPESKLIDGVLSLQPPVGLPGLGHDAYTIRDPRTGKEVASFTDPIDGVELWDVPPNRSNAIDGPAIYECLVTDDTLYFPTFPKPVPGTGRSANQIAAIDLATGRKRWISSGHSSSKVQLIRQDEQGVLAWESGDRKKAPPRLVRIDPATGKVSVVAEGPPSAGFEGESAKVMERDGVVVIVPWKHVVADRAITVLR